jgi:ParB family chromosome partitioning protein
MSDELARKRLGRGLAALIGEMDRPVEVGSPAAPAKPVAGDRSLGIDLIQRNPANPRRQFSETEVSELAASIREHGIVQPIVVRPSRNVSGQYEIIAGERRWRAAQQAGLSEIPVIIREADDRTALELAIVENVQRADLNPLEEAMGYQRLVDDHGYTQNDLAQVIGKSRSHVANTLRLLRLPDGVQALVNDGTLSAGHARSLITLDDPLPLARRIVAEGLSVRQAEQLAQAPKSGGPGKPAAAPAAKDADTLALERLLADVTGLNVVISHADKGGEVKIRYKTLEQLDSLCRKLQMQ